MVVGKRVKTMAYKALRLKAYASSLTMVLADYEGADWLTNTYIAEIDNSLPGRKKLTADNKPDLALATRILGNEVQHQSTLATERDGLECVELSFEGSNMQRIQRVYYDYIKARYPNCTMTTDDHYRYAPVRIYNDNKLVMIVMPLT